LIEIKIQFSNCIKNKIRDVRNLINAFKFSEFLDGKNIIYKMTNYYFEIFKEYSHPK